MPSDAELTFADHMGRFYARRYGYPPMVGRLIGYLSVCEPREQTLGELSDALLASRSAITGAVKTLEDIGAIRRGRAAGQRADRVSIDLRSSRALGFDVSEYEELGDLAREGLRAMADAAAERRSVLLETAALADFLRDRIPALHEEWKKHRESLKESGELQ